MVISKNRQFNRSTFNINSIPQKGLIPSQVAREYGVSVTTAIRWIKRADNKELNLDIIDYKGKRAVADTQKNRNEMRYLAKKNDIYTPTSSIKKISPKREFYELFDEEQVAEIVFDLEFRASIKTKFKYKNGGAKLWHETLVKNIHSRGDLHDLYSQIAEEICIKGGGQKFNLVDIGCGDGIPAFYFLEKTLNHIANYIPLDISPEMLDICQSTLSQTGKFHSKSLIDFDKFDMRKFLLEIKFNNILNKNLIIFLGNTILNYEKNERLNLLSKIREGMMADDLFVVSALLKKPYESNNVYRLIENPVDEAADKMILGFLGFDIDLLDYEFTFDEKTEMEKKFLILDKDYELDVQLYGHNKKLNFKVGDKIQVWQFYSPSIADISAELEKSMLKTTIIKLTEDEKRAVLVCKPIMVR